MNATIRNLIIAAPLATAALTMVPAAAMATEPGPVIIVQPVDPDPEPELDIKAPAPKPVEPKGPQDKAPAPKPEAPDDKVGPAPQPTQPDGPDVITNPEPCPTHGVDCTPDDEPKGGDEPNGGNGGESGEERNSVEDVNDTVELPNRVDAGLASQEQDGGMELAWLFAGGLAVTASGVGFAVRRRVRGNA